MEDLKPPFIEILEGPTDLKIYHCGPSFSFGPLPAFFYFALSGEESLGLDPYNQPAAFLVSNKVRLFSFTLPFHGEKFINSKAMEKWANALKHGIDFIQEFIEKSIVNINYLIESGYIDPQELAVGGLSRGGFIAVHLAANDIRFQTILGYAPLTSLESLEEFKQMKDTSLMKKYALGNLFDRLSNRHIHFLIGNRDTRVGTHACFELIKALSDKAYNIGIRSPQIELSIRPSIGHKGHGTSPKTFMEGVDWLKQKLLIVN